MPTGVDTSPEVVAKFRAHYLYSGNASESARHVEIPESTGRDLAQRLVEEPDFVADRRRLRVIELEESIVARRRVRQKALERFESDDGGIDVKRLGAEGDTVVITDKRYEYGKLVLDADKGAQNLARFDADEKLGDPGPLEVVVRLSGDDEPKKLEPDGEG